MTETAPDPRAKGRVSLIGAGPGDPDLMTVRALKRLAESDIVFVDRLVGDAITALIPSGAERVYVGKSKGDHSVPQPEIEARLAAAARSGRKVVRLKGGDPFIFGRGGEEVETLRASGVSVEVIPGVSSALAAAASAEAPLTHRRLARSVTFVSGHAALAGEPDLDWRALARPNQTVVVFMGVGTAERISRRLIEAGADPETPVLVVENASRPDERRIGGRLEGLAGLISGRSVTGPAILMIGGAAALARTTEADTSQAGAPGLSRLWEMLS